MGKHDPLVTVVRYSGPRGCAVLMHTTFGLTRKSLSKFTGMPHAAWVQTQRVPLKSHRESYRLDPVVLVKWRQPRTSPVRQRIALDWFFFSQQNFGNPSLRKALPRSWSMAHRALTSNRVLGIRLVSLADFSEVVCEVKHPSEAGDEKGFQVNSCFLLLLCFTLIYHALEEKCITRLLTGDAFERTTNEPFSSWARTHRSLLNIRYPGQ